VAFPNEREQKGWLDFFLHPAAKTNCSLLHRGWATVASYIAKNKKQVDRCATMNPEIYVIWKIFVSTCLYQPI
jgi:hypothetical protein